LPLSIRFEAENPARHLPIVTNLGARKHAALCVIGEPRGFVPGGLDLRRGLREAVAADVSGGSFICQMSYQAFTNGARP
jgi:hypothetical protein